MTSQIQESIETIGAVYDRLVVDTRMLIQDVRDNQAGFPNLHELFGGANREGVYPSIYTVSGCADLGDWPAPNTSTIIQTHFGFYEERRGGTIRSGFDLLRLMSFRDPETKEVVGTALTSNLSLPGSLMSLVTAPLSIRREKLEGPLSGWEQKPDFPQAGAPVGDRGIQHISAETSSTSLAFEAKIAVSILNQLRTRVDAGELLLQGNDPREVMDAVGWEYPEEFLP